jgi:hypothetical protein
MPDTTHSPKGSPASDLFASGFDLGALRKRISLAVSKAKFQLLPKHEQNKRAVEALKTIKELINQ